MMVLMDSVVHHDLFDHLFDDPVPLLRCAGIGSDWNRIGSDGRPRCVTGMARLSMVGVPFPIVLAPLGSIVMIINQSVRYLSGLPYQPTTKHALRV